MADKLYGPYGYMVGTIGSSEDEWSLRNDPSTDAEDFSEPLFAKRELLATRGRPMGTGEGLPRGTASAAEGEPVAWFYEFLGHNDQWIADVRLAKPKAPSGGAIRNVRPLSFASALPSPLPSQGEPVAWPEPLGFLKPEGPSTVGQRFVYARDRTETWMRQVFFLPVFAAETLAAERAKREYAEAALALTSGRLTAAEARADRAEEDVLDRLLAILIGEQRDDYRRHQNDELSDIQDTMRFFLERQGAMLPADRAALRARNILKETPHGER